jgi:hypothetical protein
MNMPVAIAPPTRKSLVFVEDRTHQELEGGGYWRPKISEFLLSIGLYMMNERMKERMNE